MSGKAAPRCAQPAGIYRVDNGALTRVGDLRPEYLNHERNTMYGSDSCTQTLGESARSTRAYDNCVEAAPARRIEMLNHQLDDMGGLADDILNKLGHHIDRIAGSEPPPPAQEGANGAKSLTSSDLAQTASNASRLYEVLRAISDQAQRLASI